MLDFRFGNGQHFRGNRGAGGGLGFGGGLGRGDGGFHVGQAGDHLGKVLNGAKGDAVAAGKEGRGDQRGAEEGRRKEFRQARAAQGARVFFGLPGRRLGQEGPDDDERNGGDQARDEGVAPCFVGPVDGREGSRGFDAKTINEGHEEAAD